MPRCLFFDRECIECGACDKCPIYDRICINCFECLQGDIDAVDYAKIAIDSIEVSEQNSNG